MNDQATADSRLADTASIDAANNPDVSDASATMDVTDVSTSPTDASEPDVASMDVVASDRPATDAADVPPVDGGVALAALTSEIAGSICSTLFRCCPTARDLNTYFGPYVASTRLDALRSRFPPNVSMASFDEAACRAVLRDAFAITPWGDWVSAANAGRVTYDSAAAARCTTALRTASCGKPAWDALVDPRCFGFTPGTGDVQRSFFRRTQASGACSFLRDGAGGVFFGTCDPTQSFCCYESGGRCTVVPGGMLPGAMGTCRAAGAVGESCAIVPALRVCRTGLECDASNRCVAERTGPLASGATCWNASDGLLGVCPTGESCNLLGSARCEARRADGAACSGGDQCRSDFCQCPSTGCTMSSEGGFVEVGRCSTWGLCVGT